MKHSDLKAFSLAEVTLALGIAAICLLAIFGLLPVGLNSNQASIEQTAAASFAKAIVSDLRNTPVISDPPPISPFYEIPFPTDSAVASHTIWLTETGASAASIDSQITPTSNAKYRVFLTLTPPPPSTKAATIVRILISWPALGEIKTSGTSEPMHAAGTFETVTALDRN